MFNSLFWVGGAEVGRGMTCGSSHFCGVNASTLAGLKLPV